MADDREAEQLELDPELTRVRNEAIAKLERGGKLTGKERFQFPDLVGWGLDIKFRPATAKEFTEAINQPPVEPLKLSEEDQLIEDEEKDCWRQYLRALWLKDYGREIDPEYLEQQVEMAVRF